MKVNWRKYEFSDCLIDNNIGRANQINASEIKKVGKFPVIDQGQDFIAGYSDEENKLIEDGLPYVIFGDHTRCFKYVDFPFIVGADGTKVLSPNSKLFDPKYFYYQLLSFDIPSRGYNRHYKLLKEKIIQKPEIPEQRKIAYVLSTIQKAVEQQDKLIKHTTELKKALMQKLFTEGTKGEKQKQTEIGLVPESWEVVNLGKYAFIENGFAFKSRDYVKSGIPLIRISNVSHGYFIDNDNKYLPERHLKTYSKFALQKGDLIISLTRPVTSGGLKYCFVEEKDLPALLNQRVGRFQIKNKTNLSKDYLFHLVFSNYFVGELFKLFGSSSQQPNVSPSQLEGFKVPIPKIEEQNEIANILFLLFNKIRKAEEKKQTLTELFKTMLNELMTGQRRVHNIKFN